MRLPHLDRDRPGHQFLHEGQHERGERDGRVAPSPRDHDDHLARTLEWALEHLAQPLTVEQLAMHASMSLRTFARRSTMRAAGSQRAS